MVATADAHALVAAARDVARIDTAAGTGLWPRAAALLARQGLEAALISLWAVAAPGLEHATMRCQLLCAGTMLRDPDLGGRVAAAWNVLSDGCHHSGYELPPSALDLEAAMATVWQLADAAVALRAKAGR